MLNWILNKIKYYEMQKSYNEKAVALSATNVCEQL